MLISLFSNETRYKIFPTSANNFSTFAQFLAEVSKKNSNRFFSLTSFPCSNLTCLLLYKIILKLIITYCESSTSALFPIKTNFVSGEHKLLHCLIHSSRESKLFILSIA